MQNDTCYILALIKRDDGERLLLGSGFYEFSAGQKHFNPNQFANDVVELQGTDGQLLAGQVRRSTSQVFEGVIGDGTTSKQMVEQKRREFFLFFRKQHHYTVVYIMPDGTAIKRDRGYITEAPAVQELYQFQPKWRVALAFEDVNYYSYAEDDQGQEIYSFEATLALANISDGGLVWDDKGAISDAYVHTGKNLFNDDTATDSYIQSNGTITPNSAWRSSQLIKVEPNTSYIWHGEAYSVRQVVWAGYNSSRAFISGQYAQVNSVDSLRIITGENTEYIRVGYRSDGLRNMQLELGSTATPYEPYSPGFSTGGYIFAPSTGGGPVVVTVNGVDNASPVWRITGPATNPTLTNSTTGQSLIWNGTVPAGQTLVIDMGAQTATLEGANVFEFVSGSWVQLEPGQNRISYTAGNTTRSSVVQWNEVVG